MSTGDGSGVHSDQEGYDTGTESEGARAVKRSTSDATAVRVGVMAASGSAGAAGSALPPATLPAVLPVVIPAAPIAVENAAPTAVPTAAPAVVPVAAAVAQINLPSLEKSSVRDWPLHEYMSKNAILNALRSGSPEILRALDQYVEDAYATGDADVVVPDSLLHVDKLLFNVILRQVHEAAWTTPLLDRFRQAKAQTGWSAVRLLRARFANATAKVAVEAIEELQCLRCGQSRDLEVYLLRREQLIQLLKDVGEEPTLSLLTSLFMRQTNAMEKAEPAIAAIFAAWRTGDERLDQILKMLHKYVEQNRTNAKVTAHTGTAALGDGRGVCSRCGRNNHTLKDCHARRHLTGKTLVERAVAPPPAQAGKGKGGGKGDKRKPPSAALPPGDAQAAPGACWNCKEPGHTRARCPLLVPHQGGPPRPQGATANPRPGAQPNLHVGAHALNASDASLQHIANQVGQLTQLVRQQQGALQSVQYFQQQQQQLQQQQHQPLQPQQQHSTRLLQPPNQGAQYNAQQTAPVPAQFAGQLPPGSVPQHRTNGPQPQQQPQQGMPFARFGTANYVTGYTSMAHDGTGEFIKGYANMARGNKKHVVLEDQPVGLMTRIVDTGATHHLHSSHDPTLTGVERADVPLQLSTACEGEATVLTHVGVAFVPRVGWTLGWILTGVICLLSVSALAREGWGFSWTHTGPVLETPDGWRWALSVEDGLPVLREGDTAMAEPPRTAEQDHFGVALFGGADVTLEDVDTYNDGNDEKVDDASVESHGEEEPMHCVTHTPARADCEACVVAKMRRKPAKRRLKSTPHATDFGEIWYLDTAGPVHPGPIGETHFTLILDDATGWLTCFCRSDVNTVTTVAMLSAALSGLPKPRLIRHDGGSEFAGEELARLCVEWDTKQVFSPAGESTSQAIIERAIQTVVDGAATLLSHASLSTVLWPFALQCWIHGYNRAACPSWSVFTPWAARFGAPFHKHILPFGALVGYRKNTEYEKAARQKRDRFAGRARRGLLLGPVCDQVSGASENVYQVVDVEDGSLWRTRQIKPIVPYEFPGLGSDIFPIDSDAPAAFERPPEIECNLCGLRIVLLPITCRACCGHHRRHTRDPTCQIGRCSCPGRGDLLWDVPDADAVPDADVVFGAEHPHVVFGAVHPDVSFGAESPDVPLGAEPPDVPVGAEPFDMFGSILDDGPVEFPAPVRYNAPVYADYADSPDEEENVTVVSTIDRAASVFDDLARAVGNLQSAAVSTPVKQTDYYDLGTPAGASPMGSPDRWIQCDSCDRFRLVDPIVLEAYTEDTPFFCSHLMGCDCSHEEDDRAHADAFVTRAVTVTEARQADAGRAALDAELEKLLSLGAFSYEEVIEQDDVLAAFPSEHLNVVDSHMIVGLKHSELPPDAQVWKARFVADRTSSLRGAELPPEQLYGVPMELTHSSAVAAFGLSLPGGTVQTADVESAYLQADRGGPRTYLRLRKAWWPDAWNGRFRRPLVPLHTPLYGERRAGSDFYVHLQAVLVQIGWKPVDGYLSVYTKDGSVSGLGMMLGVYVDDLMLGASAPDIGPEWDAVQQYVPLTISTGSGFRFLSIQFTFQQNREGVVLYRAQTEYAEKLLGRFKEIAGFLPDHKLRGVDAPWSVLKPSAEDAEAPGVFAPHASSLVAALQWLARGSRPDLSAVVAHLARFVLPTKWRVSHDSLLLHLFKYIQKYTYSRLVSQIFPEDLYEEWTLYLACDSDWATCPITRKSVSGYAAWLAGTHGSFSLIAWGSKLQTAVASSSAAAEAAATHQGLTRAGLPLQDLFSCVRSKITRLVVLGDNTSSLRAIDTGISQSLQTLARTHGIQLGWIRDVVSDPSVSMSWVASGDNVADVFTKALQPATHGIMCCLLRLELL